MEWYAMVCIRWCDYIHTYIWNMEYRQGGRVSIGVYINKDRIYIYVLRFPFLLLALAAAAAAFSGDPFSSLVLILGLACYVCSLSLWVITFLPPDPQPLYIRY